MTSFSPVRFLALCGALAAASFTVPAHAGFADCGNINVSAEAKCKAEVSGGCTAQCTPVHFQLACAGQLEATCATTCSELPSVSCTGSCEADCDTQCNVNPGSFDCEGSCTGKCEGTCAAKCSGSASAGGGSADAQAKCEASCKATCGGECHASCTGTPPTADCSGKCKASCSGSCKADLNMDCQTNCQADGYAKCETDLEGGCTAQCSQPEGAVFCDGQYVDEGGHAQKCIDALDAWLKEHVDVSASGQASSGCGDIDGGGCHAEASGEVKASSKCSVSRVDEESDSTGFAAALAGLVGLAAMARRKRG
ncbi:MAG TPA: hypothetical protein VHE30_28565 [Polyangiaceae bacterium]|nr:hypothetical protein [Polyangiaceae bacterium]